MQIWIQYKDLSNSDGLNGIGIGISNILDNKESGLERHILEYKLNIVKKRLEKISYFLTVAFFILNG